MTVVAPGQGIKTLKELVAAAKSGNISYASAGVGSATHWAAERLRLSAGFEAVHVPFRGGPEALTEVMTGRVDFTCMGIAAALPFIRDGKLMPLAVSSAKRSSALPDVPTTLEAGLADSDYNYWMGMFVPAKTPREIVERLYRETQKALRMPERGGEIRPARDRAAAADVGRVRRHDQAGDRDQHRAGQGGRAEVQLRRGRESESMTTRRRLLGLAATGLAMPVLPRLARAQAWPARPIRAIIPFTAGSTVDIVGAHRARSAVEPARPVDRGGEPRRRRRHDRRRPRWPRPIPTATPCWITCLGAFGGACGLSEHRLRSGARISSRSCRSARSPNMTVVAPDKGIKTLKELVAAAKRGRDDLRHRPASAAPPIGPPSASASAPASRRARAVPRRPEALTEVMTGRVDFASMGIAAALPLHPRQQARSRSR